MTTYEMVVRAYSYWSFSALELYSTGPPSKHLSYYTFCGYRLQISIIQPSNMATKSLHFSNCSSLYHISTN